MSKLARATRATYLRHAWALRSLTGLRVKPNGLRHIEQSLQAVASLDLPVARKFEILSVVDDYVFGHCASLMRSRGQAHFERKTVQALSEAMNRYLTQGDYPLLRAMIGDDDPVDVLARNSGFVTEERHFDIGLEALLEWLTKRFRLNDAPPAGPGSRVIAGRPPSRRASRRGGPSRPARS